MRTDFGVVMTEQVIKISGEKEKNEKKALVKLSPVVTYSRARVLPFFDNHLMGFSPIYSC